MLGRLSRWSGLLSKPSVARLRELTHLRIHEARATHGILLSIAHKSETVRPAKAGDLRNLGA